MTCKWQKGLLYISSHNNTTQATLSARFTVLLTSLLHVHKHHEAPAEPSHKKQRDMHAVDDQAIQHPKVQAPVTQQQQDDGQFVLQSQEYTHADILQKEEGGERYPEQRSQQTAAKVEEEPKETVHAAGALVQVKVVVFGAHQLGSVCSPAGRVHAGGVRAMEAAHSPWDGNHRHGWATRAQHGEQGPLVGSSGGLDAEGAAGILNLDHLAPTRATKMRVGSQSSLRIPVTVSPLNATRSCKDVAVVKRFLHPQMKTCRNVGRGIDINSAIAW